MAALKPSIPAHWYPKRGDICLVTLDKVRPALIISVDGLNLHSLDVCIVPISTVQHKKFSLRPLIKAGDGGLKFDSWAKCDQVTTIPKAIVKYPPLGRVSRETLVVIERGIKSALGLLS